MNPYRRKLPPAPGRGSPVLASAVSAFVLLAVTLAARADQFDTLRVYWLNQLIGTNNNASTLSSRANNANGDWSSMVTNAGRAYLWSDLPLGSTSANISSTFGRLKTMALAWATTNCSLQGNTDLAAAITGGLDWMSTNAYSPATAEYNNWWDWEIGGPQAFNDAALMMYPALSGTEISSYNSSVDHFSPPTTSWMTGANLTDKCKVVLIRGIIGKSSAKMASGQTNLSPVFPYVTTSDGFYRDGSFVQHTHIAYTGTYGIVLLGDVAQLVNLLNGSTWQIADPNLGNVYSWVTNSYEPVIYNGAMMDMVRGRAISRYGEQESNDGGSAINDIRQIAQFAPAAAAAAFTNWAGSPSLRPGQYQFADMDRVVAWRSNFCFGLSMSSSRIANYECINGENLHGWFTGDGMTYLYLGKPESQFTGDYWPTVDPYHLPGTTVDTTTRADASGEGATTSQNWVGGAQVSQSYGSAGMSLAAYGSTLVAKKSWFMFDNEIVCLGAGITCGGANEIHTTVEDRRLGGTPTNNFTADGTTYPPVTGWASSPTNATWCVLDGVGGYYFPGGATNLQAAFAVNTGSWSGINNGTYTSTTTNLLTDNYFTLMFNHGIKPTNSAYAYVLLPAMTAVAVSNYAAAPDIVILTNSPTIQAAAKPSLGVVTANFWTTGTNAVDLITVNRKASVITREQAGGIAVGVSDPTQTNTGAITLTLNRAAAAAVSVDPGITVSQLSPQIILSVNVNGSLGKTYQAAFLYPPPTLTWDASTGTPGAQDGSGSWESQNWWTGSTDASWVDAPAGIAAFGAGGIAGNVSISKPHNVFSVLFNPVGSGAYTLSGSGTLTVSNGMTANAAATVSVPVNLAGAQTWTVATNQVLNLNSNLLAAAPVVLSLAGPGTVNFGSSNQISTNLTIGFIDTLNRTSLGIATNSQTVAAVDLNDGVVAAVSGRGSLVVNGPADFTIGGGTTGASQLLDLSGLNQFVCGSAGNNFSVGGQVNGVAGSGTVYLAATNILTAANLGVQNVTGSTSGQSSGSLFLGRNTTINADGISVGLTRDNGFIRFNAGLANPALVLRASDGVGRANVTVGTRGSSYSSVATGLVDLTTNVTGVSSLDARIGTLLLANEGYCLTASDVLNGTFIMGGGTLDASAITIGSKNSASSQSTGIVNGTFTQSNGLVKVSALTLGDKTTGNTGTLNATYNLSGGILAAQTIMPGANSATRNFNWGGGVMSNYDAGTDLTVAAGLNLVLSSSESMVIGAGRAGTVNSVISGAGSLVAGGPGTLILAATNTYSGTTTVSSGTLLVTGATGTNSMTVAAGATLGGMGTINGPTTIQSGGAIQNGPANLTIGTLTLGSGGLATTCSAFSIAAGGRISVTNLSVGGTNVINILDQSLAAGTNTLFTFVGSIAGGGSFKLGTLPSNVSARLQNNGQALQLVTSPLIPPVFGGQAIFTGAGFAFSFNGTNGESYRILWATNLSLPLSNWPVLAGGIFGSSQVNYTDVLSTNVQRFYRLTSP